MKVKKKNRGRPSQTESKLSANQILIKAKFLLNESEKIPSIRKLANELNIDPMAIYYYFPCKDALLEALVISLMEDIYEPKQNQNWEEELKQLSESYLDLLSKSAGLLEIILSMNTRGPAAVFNEKFEIIISALNLSEHMKQNILNLLVDYLHGFSMAMICNTDKNKLSITESDNSLTLITNLLKQELLVAQK